MSNNSEIKTLGDPERLLLSKPTEEERAIFQFYKDNPSLACKDLLKQDLAPFQRIVIDGVMSHSFVISVLARGSGKTRMMAMCAALLAMFNPKMRVLLIGPSFRQSKLSFNEFLDILDGSEHLDACVKRTSRQTDMWTAEFHNNAAIFSMPLVADNPASIRGIRAHAVLIDEYPHVPKEVIDAVINPMLATVRNPMAAVRKIEYENKLREMGMEVESEKTNANKICGFSSAYYQYNHMYKTMQEYKKLAIEEKTKYGKSNHAVYIFNYKDAPEGFFDMETVEHSRRTSPDIIFAMEYLSEFPADSEGFYKRSLLDSCISEPPNDFYIELEGDTKSRYIVGIDPARNSDSLAIVILKLDGEYMKLVNVITFQNTPFPLVARFLRNLLKKYNIELIGMDAGGGGLAMKDLLEDPTTANTKDEIVLDIDDELSVGKEGRKILRFSAPPDSFREKIFLVEVKTNCLDNVISFEVIIIPSLPFIFFITLNPGFDIVFDNPTFII